jgi:hypothetical protein
MARTTLAERQHRLQQQRARLQLEENRLREAERKARTRRLIEAGALVEKAGLLELESNTLYGALLAAASALVDPARLEAWHKAGGQAFDREAKAREAGKEPLILILEGAQPTAVTTRLRQAGFRWSKVMRHWEGLVRPDEAQALAAEFGGTVQRVDTSPPDTRPTAGSRAAA